MRRPNISRDFDEFSKAKAAMIGPYDLQIASIAIANGHTLVSHNSREFNRVPGLVLEDWEILL